MLKFNKLSNRVIYAANSSQRILTAVKPLASNNNFHLTVNKTLQINNLFKKTDQVRLTLCGYKSKAKKSKPKYGQSEEDSDDDEEEEDEDEEVDFKGKGFHDKTLNLESLRIDTLLKKALGFSRKKIELSFYENRMRVNGCVLFKKSIAAKVGDEIDIVKEVSKENPDFLIVTRVEVLNSKADPETGRILVKVRTSKTLLIYNYPDGDKWKPKEVESEN